MFFIKTDLKQFLRPILTAYCILLTVACFAQTAGQVIEHKVEKGQTLFGIARKYQASVADIRALNEGLKDGLQVDQIIKVPVKVAQGQAVTEIAKPAKSEKVEKAEIPAPDNNRPENVVIPAGAKTHVVGAGQTLSMIARTYKTTVADILKLNNLKNPSISVGQRIIVTAPAAVADAIKKPTAAAQIQASAAPVAEQAPNGEIIVPVVGNASVGASGLEQQVDKGLAEGIDQDDNNKQQCLHRTAPVGTVVKVKNDLNGLSIYAKVVGKLQDIGQNERLVIRLSKSAFEKLMPTEKRFPVTVVYSAPVVK